MSFKNFYENNKQIALLEHLIIGDVNNVDHLLDSILTENLEVDYDVTNDKVKFVKIAKMYDKSVAKHQNKRNHIETKVKAFIAFKKENPTVPITANDSPFRQNTKIWHYHITGDLSLIYHLKPASEKNVIKIIMFGIYSHDEIGSSKNLERSTIYNKIASMI